MNTPMLAHPGGGTKPAGNCNAPTDGLSNRTVGTNRDSGAFPTTPESTPLVMVRAARCGNCGTDVPRGFRHRKSDWSFLFPFVVEVEWVRKNPTRCTNCFAEGSMLFVTETYDDPFAAVAS